MAAKIKADWEKVAAHYRAGIRTLRDIASEFGITEGAIRKRARAEEWPRDMSEKIRLRADDLVRKAEVRKGTFSASDLEVEKASAGHHANIRLEHNAESTEVRRGMKRMLDELFAQNADPELYEKLAVMMADPLTDSSVLNRALQKAISLPSRASSAKTLMEAYRVSVDNERKVLKIDKEDGGGDGKWTVIISKEDAEL